MCGGAAFVLLTGSITPKDALMAVSPDVMLFLSGVFIIGAGLFKSGVLESLSNRIFSKAKNQDVFLLSFIFLTGLLSAVLMNDTVAIIAAPLAVTLSKKFRLPPEMLLLALAFSVTTGSVASPVGNPQNLLIATMSGIENPFFAFLYYLGLPTLLSLIFVYLCLRFLYREHFKDDFCTDEKREPSGFWFFDPSFLSLLILAGLILSSAVLSGYGIHIPLFSIAIISALPLLLFSKKRMEILREADWHTLLFFAAMFVLMQSVWNTGFFQAFFEGSGCFSFTPALTMLMGLIVSQFISNVPFVALFMPLVLSSGAGPNVLMSLAAGSTLAGNLLLFGAASNIIIVQNAEKKGICIGFLRFAKAGVLITGGQVVIYLLYILTIS
ncbi:anion transporter [Methanoplanus sp. FWC-SCC4]|uniref:Anion transporter n=2 Tax=Methanochimaera problematica TaxID=2609417 RepID=A0AA97FFQ6_9EURY|nr:anion transporter [Methanoplanus sp. FWC-SCC4]